MPHNMPRNHHTPGRGSAERGGAGKNRDGGTSRTPSPTGRLRVGRGCVNGYAQASVTQKPVGVGVPDDPLFRRPRGKNKQYNEKSRLLGRGPTPAPTYDDRQRTGVAYFFAPRIQIKNAAPRAAFSPFCATAMRIAIKNAPAGRFHSSRGADTLAAPQSPVLPMSLRAMPPVDQFSIRPRCHSVRDGSVKTRPNCGASPGNVAQMMMGVSGVRVSVS